MISISILCENHVGLNLKRDCMAEWGLSFFIEDKSTKILFDSGHTNIFSRNANVMGFDLDSIDCIALSHHHWDHINGLFHCEFIEKKRLILHPELLMQISNGECKYLTNKFKIIESEKVFKLAENIFFLGEIPRVTNFEAGTYKDKAMLDDTAIAIKTQKGVVVVTGCSHSGICNICEHAKKVTGQRLHAVIGGFHLTENERKLVEQTIAYFHQEQPDFLYPMHCVDFATLSKFHQEFGCTYLGSGDTIDIDSDF